jgi:hypothetical protein
MCAVVISGIIFGSLLAIAWQPNKSSVLMDSPSIYGLLREKNGPGYIQYQSTGPTFSSFAYGCNGLYDPSHNCLHLYSDGKPGIVQVKISSFPLNDFPWIGNVKVYSHGLPFQRVSQDSNQTTLRFEAPSNYTSITLQGGLNVPLWAVYVINASVLSMCMFFVSLLFAALVCYCRERLISKKFYSVSLIRGRL